MPGEFLTDVRTSIRATRADELQELLEMAPDAMLIANTFGQIVVVNDQALQMFGYDRDELLGEQVEILVPERFRTRHVRHRTAFGEDPHRRAMGEGQQLFGRRADGSEFPVEISLSPVIRADGSEAIATAIRDVTARRAAEQAAFHFAAVVESSHDAIIGKDLKGTILSWNKGAERLYGYTAEEAIGRSISMLVPPGQDDELPDMLRRVLQGERVEDLETVRARKDGTHVDVSLTVSPIHDRNGTVVGASTIVRDISARLRYQEQLRFLAEHDALTGVRNRRRFERDVFEQVARARRYGEQAAALIIDVDRFKEINDRYGHRTGDRTLKAIAAAFGSRLRDTDTIARIGGDEFAIVLPYAGLGQAQIVADSLRAAVAGLQIETPTGEHLSPSISIGMVLIDENTESDEAALAEADRAMYREKRHR